MQKNANTQGALGPLQVVQHLEGANVPKGNLGHEELKQAPLTRGKLEFLVNLENHLITLTVEFAHPLQPPTRTRKKAQLLYLFELHYEEGGKAKPGGKLDKNLNK